ncbi:leukocyte immunoglobulin-like receptor subfamily B member 3 [Pteronotus mesoamericanus]|uniref:leukocyte immunoglobulin-like receptor subfamily B member 3 n=1 Tax=Pteronotus mesoamericanus TaxID=1884717 RepID=UPI0023EBD48F|nr:leukocyte immunoglobulin-like receptor subfamily B member 3 [Pteronotus parnellii mesoamericanus]
MGRGPRTPTLTALLCLGLCGGPWDQVRAEALPRPSLWADPGPMVSKGSPVTLWCQASLRADAYGLYKERRSEPRLTRIPQASSNKTRFRIRSTTSHHAGLYECAYRAGRTLSERSEPLVLVVTGAFSAPSLAAQPSPVVASGGNVSLVCTSQSTSGPFHLLNEGGAEPPRRMESERRSNDGRSWTQAVFPVGPVSASRGGTYRCYASSGSYPHIWSHPSDPVHIQVTGLYRSPSLRAQPASLLLPGDNLTLQCRSEPGFDRFALTKDEGPAPPQRLKGQRSPDFPLGPVARTHGGRYRCYSGHSLSHAWSAPSAPLDVLIAGADSKPSLSARPPPPGPWGANVTLLCRSDTRADTFHLHREGSLDPPLELRLQGTAAPSEATFTISPVTSGHGGTYRCYSSHSASRFLLSQPSDPLELLVPEALPRPSLWADPGPMVSKGSPVTLWCQGSLRADAYGLYKERRSEPWLTSIPQASNNKTGFRIRSTTSHDAAPYECVYRAGHTLSERSEPLVLVVTGVFSAPSLAAQPSPVVASGGNVSLVCTSQSTSGPFHLLNEGGAEPPRRMESERRSNDGTSWTQAVFPVGPVSASRGGTYRCYASSGSYPHIWSHPSDPVHIQVTGLYRSPSLRAQPASLLLPGDNLTLQCRSEPGFDRFALTKDEGPTPPQRLDGQHSPDFPLGPVTRTHGGRYRCYSGHSLSHAWSAPSAPLDVLIAGADSKPSLSARPRPLGPWGANVTLLCRSETKADTFHLQREGSLDPPLELRLQGTAAPSEATFTISPVTSGHGGTYRCYSSHSTSPFLLSQPSDPLELAVSDSTAHDYTVGNAVRLGVSGLILLVLGGLLLEAWHSQRRPRGAARSLTDSRPRTLRGLSAAGTFLGHFASSCSGRAPGAHEALRTDGPRARTPPRTCVCAAWLARARNHGPATPADRPACGLRRRRQEPPLSLPGLRQSRRESSLLKLPCERAQRFPRSDHLSKLAPRPRLPP